MLEIGLLGGFRLVRDGAPIVGADAPLRLQTLLAYLILRRDQSHLRQRIASDFWPDTSEAQARTNLRHVIHDLRAVLPDSDQFVRFEGQPLQWRSDAPFTCDVIEFELALARAEIEKQPAEATQSLLHAISLYQGDLLPACYDDWIIPHRERLQQRSSEGLKRLIALLESQRDYNAALEYANRLLRLDPLDEATHQIVMRLHAQSGDRPRALRAYHTCVTTLQRELGAEPSAETRALHAQLLREDPTTSRQPVAHATQRSLLVGRYAEWNTLHETWHAASLGKPLCALVSGEAGVGKTRLAEELMRWLARQGIATASARCYAAEGALAYAPIVAWLRSEPIRKRLRSLDAVWLTELSRLLPELLTEQPGLPPPAPLAESWQRQRLFEAMVRAVTSTHEPLLLFMDDLQWCDHETTEWLHYLLRTEQAAHMLILCTVRAEEVGVDHPLNEFKLTLQKSGHLHELDLGPLSAEHTAELATYVAGQALPVEQAAHLFRESEGNPLFIVEMVRSGLSAEDQEASQSASMLLPSTVQAVIARRLGQLTPEARDLANLAAVIGREFTYDILAQASSADEDTLVRGLDELWQRRIIREPRAATSATKDAYDFSHDKIREVTYAGLSAARRRLLHRRVASALESVYAGDLDTVSGQLAAHYERSGLTDAAINYYARAAEAAQRVFANDEAMRHYRAALSLLARGTTGAHGDERMLTLNVQLGDVLRLMSKYDEAVAAYQRALEATREFDEADEPNRLLRARLNRKLSRSLILTRRYTEAEQVLHDALDTLGPEPDAIEYIQRSAAWWREWSNIHTDMMMRYYWLGDWAAMTPLADKARFIVELYGSARQRAAFYMALAYMCLRRDCYVTTDETLDYMRLYLHASQQVDDPSDLAFAKFNNGFAWLWRGDFNRADAFMHEAFTLAERIGDLDIQSRCLTYLTISARMRGRVDQVRLLNARSMAVAQAANRPEYIATAHANDAWLAWRDHDQGAVEAHVRDALAVEAHVRDALANWSQPVGGHALWFEWTAQFPLLAARLEHDDMARAIECARDLLHPSHLRLPDPLMATLEASVAACERGQANQARAHLERVIMLAQEMRYL
jgi:DNA-binding SARP family transcriptional activator